MQEIQNELCCWLLYGSAFITATVTDRITYLSAKTQADLRNFNIYSEVQADSSTEESKLFT